ncbi:uncharacterized protein LOC128892988 [Hylaeus anthracinus]|uniref:uncharacterized protein LOC128892988 n=1 Tax=Hylaeus anthracinus TaxID=313031 RepID=UPI0023B9A51E|nr:uncharacterized protein LOC128892988 [Hylaeus anthracinus]
MMGCKRQNLLGSEALKLLETFNLSEEDIKDPDAILEVFGDHAKPELNETYERFLFTSRDRYEGESINQYVAELKKLSKNCNYGTVQDSLIRGNIIGHLKDKRLQQSVLKIKNLTLRDLIQNIKTQELSESQAEKIQESNEQVKIDVVKQQAKHSRRHSNKGEPHTYNIRRNPDEQRGKQRETDYNRATSNHQRLSDEQSTFTCKKCDRRHGRQQCPAFGKTCSKCNKSNHFSVVYRSRGENKRINTYCQ